MKFSIINGSPRNKKSNSKILVNHFLNGYHKVSPESVPVYYIADRKQQEITTAFQNSDPVIIIFPLYTDCMPEIVKEFFENIAKLKPSPAKKVGFIVQSGFPEAIHSVFIERYLEKLTKRLQYEYLGTIIKGGVEGIQLMPERITKKLFEKFESLGEYFAKNKIFSSKIQSKLRKPYKLSSTRIFIFKIMSKTGLTNFMWNKDLKANNTFENRFDRPFAEANSISQK